MDPVARFHLGNGARVERLNWAGDPSAKGLEAVLWANGQLPVRPEAPRQAPRHVRAGTNPDFWSHRRPVFLAGTSSSYNQGDKNMNHSFTRRDILRAAAAGAAALTPLAHAQSAWPARPVMMIVPFPAGGGTDAFARPLAAQFAKQTGKQLVIDNKGGAGGTVGASIAARALQRRLHRLHGRRAPHDRAVDVPQARLRPGEGLRAADPGGQRAAGGGGQSQAHRGPGLQGLPRADAQEPRQATTTARPAPARRTTWPANCSSSRPRPSSPTSPTRGAGPALRT